MTIKNVPDWPTFKFPNRPTNVYPSVSRIFMFFFKHVSFKIATIIKIHVVKIRSQQHLLKYTLCIMIINTSNNIQIYSQENTLLISQIKYFPHFAI